MAPKGRWCNRPKYKNADAGSLPKRTRQLFAQLPDYGGQKNYRHRPRSRGREQRRHLRRPSVIATKMFPPLLRGGSSACTTKIASASWRFFKRPWTLKNRRVSTAIASGAKTARMQTLKIASLSCAMPAVSACAR